MVCLLPNNEFRLKTFFKGRPLSIRELRNPRLAKLVKKNMWDFHNTTFITVQLF